MTWLHEQLEAVAAEPPPVRPRSRPMPFLPRTDVPRRARVFVVDNDAFDATRARLAGELLPGLRERPRVVLLKTVHGYGITSLWSSHALARLAAPLLDVSRSADENERPPSWAAEPPSHAAAERFMVHAAAYGCEHTVSRAGELDPEAWALELDRSTRLTADAPAAYLELGDAAVAAVARALNLRALPLLVIPVDLVTESNPRWVDVIDRASRVLAHERVVFVAYCLPPMLEYVRRPAAEAAFRVGWP